MDDEVRTVSPTGGEKGVKPERYDLIPIECLAEVARHYGVGALKYEDRNWERGYKWSNSYAALQRHANAFWSGESYDRETGTHHLAAVVFHAFTLMQFDQHYPEYDDRSKLNAQPLPHSDPGERHEGYSASSARYDARGGTVLGRSGGNADGPESGRPLMPTDRIVVTPEMVKKALAPQGINLMGGSATAIARELETQLNPKSWHHDGDGVISYQQGGVRLIVRTEFGSRNAARRAEVAELLVDVLNERGVTV